jgi:hypothetical protein
MHAPRYDQRGSRNPIPTRTRLGQLQRTPRVQAVHYAIEARVGDELAQLAEGAMPAGQHRGAAVAVVVVMEADTDQRLIHYIDLTAVGEPQP